LANPDNYSRAGIINRAGKIICLIIHYPGIEYVHCRKSETKKAAS
jgi:hypothetical protein